jgi:3-hydroxyacyl-[acyl-carrier-protein] dehydratase
MSFAFIDEILELDAGRSVRASRTWPADLPLFADHLPGKPVVPGVLLVEMMGQAAASCVEAVEPSPGKAMLVQIRNAIFRRWVLPGEPIEVRAEVRSLGVRHAIVACHAEVEGARAAEAELMFSFISWGEVPGYRDDALERYRRDHHA